ncbi:MAG: class I SAM-dependent methyltransferase [Planctomycetota bacterium]
MEYTKFGKRRAPYGKALAEIQQMDFTFHDYIHHNPAFAGHTNLARFLALHETYKQTLGLAGHIAEVGVWKASCLLYFAKLTRIFEPESPTLVHGFDWFKGTVWGPDEQTDKVQKLIAESATSEEENRPRTDAEAEAMYATIKKLIAVQGLDNIAHLHKLDLTKDLDRFFGGHPHIQFKIVFMDSGTYEVTKACLPHFWPRLVVGGVMILDQFNHEIAPGETRAVREYLPDMPVHSYGFTNHPSAYIVKPGSTEA